MGLLRSVRESGADFGIAVGRGTDDDPDVVVDVQIAATGRCAAALVDLVTEWHDRWVNDYETPASATGGSAASEVVLSQSLCSPPKPPREGE